MTSIKVIEKMDELAIKSLSPDQFELWSQLVRYYDKHFPHFKGARKDYHG